MLQAESGGDVGGGAGEWTGVVVRVSEQRQRCEPGEGGVELEFPGEEDAALDVIVFGGAVVELPGAAQCRDLGAGVPVVLGGDLGMNLCRLDPAPGRCRGGAGGDLVMMISTVPGWAWAANVVNAARMSSLSCK
ncbi:hypothetical protein QDK53_38570 [Amycolatopsis magusensis]|nr:hypothetical protein [Amycolatopsis magusensis]MDI5982157.1 hypothetical protein [Amycolatopsis magusensis]